MLGDAAHPTTPNMGQSGCMAIEDAVVTAARKQFKTGEDLRARYNPETGDVELFALMTVVDEIQDESTEISLADVEEMGVEPSRVIDSAAGYDESHRAANLCEGALRLQVDLDVRRTTPNPRA